MKLIYDERDTALADMCFSNIAKTHSVYKMNHNFFRDSFESVPDFRKLVLSLFLIINDFDFLAECGNVVFFWKFF